MTTDDLQIVETHGPPLDRARQFGEATRDGLAAFLELTAPSLRVFETPRGQALRENLLAHFYALDPPMDLLEAFCESAPTTPEAIIERAASFSAIKSKLDVECSGLFLRKGDHVAMGQNLDTGEECKTCNYFEIGRGPDTEGYARFCWPSPLSWMHGINLHGVCMTGCSGPAGSPMGDGNGLPVLLARWNHFYRCATAQEVSDAVHRHRVVGKGTNCLFATLAEGAVRVELSGGEMATEWAARSHAAATGYRWLLSDENLGANPPEKAAAERARWERVMDLIAGAARADGDPVADLKRILADHHTRDGHPHSAPCRHDAASSTQFSFIYDLTDRVVHYCGQPCSEEWRSIAL